MLHNIQNEHQAIVSSLELFLNQMINILKDYARENPNKIKKNEKGRRDDVLAIAKMIYDFANFPINIDASLDINKIPKIENITWQFDYALLQQFKQMLDQINKHFENIQTSIGSSSLRDKFLKFIYDNKDFTIKKLDSFIQAKSIQENQTNSILYQLPQEILIYLLTFLEPTEILKVALTSTLLHQVCDDEQLWCQQIQKNFPGEVDKVKQQKDAKFKSMFFQLEKEYRKKPKSFFVVYTENRNELHLVLKHIQVHWRSPSYILENPQIFENDDKAKIWLNEEIGVHFLRRSIIGLNTFPAETAQLINQDDFNKVAPHMVLLISIAGTSGQYEFNNHEIEFKKGKLIPKVTKQEQFYFHESKLTLPHLEPWNRRR